MLRTRTKANRQGLKGEIARLGVSPVDSLQIFQTSIIEGSKKMESTHQPISHVKPIKNATVHTALLVVAVWFASAMLSPALQVNAQIPLRVQAKDFVVPATDDQGRKTTLYGKSGKPLSSGLWEVEGMRVETLRDQKKDMIVEAPHCLFDSKSRVAFSPGELIVHKADEQFSIRGQGFRWQQADSRLIISNRVHTVIRKGLLGTPASVSPPSTRKPAVLPRNDSKTGKTNALPSKSETIEIDSDYFEHRSDVAIFRQNVRVKDGEGNLRCGILKVVFEASGSGAERIEADENVVFEQDEIRAMGDKALYIPKQQLVTFTGNPTWKIAEKEGSGEVLIIDNKTKSFRVEGHVSVKLLPDKMIPLSWLSTPSPSIAPAQTNQPVSILGDVLNYTTELAVFRGHVQIIDARGGSLTCGVLTNIFSEQDGKLSELVAEHDVVFKQGETSARGERALYQVTNEVVILTGNPSWKIGQGEGHAEILIINPKTQTIRAERNVAMKLFSQAISSLDLSLPQTQGQRHSHSSTNQEIVIASDSVQFKASSAIFVHNVRLTHPGDSEREMTCEVLAAFFVEPGNMLDQIIAEEKVAIRQGDLRALGNKVVYWVPKGLMELTGNPELSTPARKYRADKFTLDRVSSTFRMKGNYKIEIERGSIGGSARLAP